MRDPLGFFQPGFTLTQLIFHPLVLCQIEHKPDAFAFLSRRRLRIRAARAGDCRPCGNTPSRTVARRRWPVPRPSSAGPDPAIPAGSHPTAGYGPSEIFAIISQHAKKRVIGLDKDRVVGIIRRNFPSEDPDDVGLDKTADLRFSFVQFQRARAEHSRGRREGAQSVIDLRHPRGVKRHRVVVLQSRRAGFEGLDRDRDPPVLPRRPAACSTQSPPAPRRRQ